MTGIHFNLDELQTGDVILFSTNKWYSDLIELGDECVFSHCGMILRDPVYIDPSLQGLFLLESGLEPFPDAVDHQIHFGVQIVPLIKVIDEYVIQREGQVYRRKLNCVRNEELEEKIKQAYHVARDKPYNCNPFDWLEALLGFHWFDRKITSRFWCSALVAFMFVKVGFLDSTIDWTLVTPRDWWSGSKSQFVFKDGVSLDLENQLL
jgi:hypothetical protein